MKKKSLFCCFILLFVVAFLNIRLNNKEKTPLTAIALENLNALAYAESFNWDGNNWNDTDDDHWYGTHWKPIMVDCTVTIGMPWYQVSYNGKKVTCNNGSGNCSSASDCTNS